MAELKKTLSLGEDMSDVEIQELKSPSGRRYPSQSRLYTYQGKTLSLKGWARELGICHASLLRRIAKFGDGEESLPFVFANKRYPRSGGRKKELMHNGRKTSFKELSRQYGISEQRLRERVRAGWTLDRALTTSSFDARSQASKTRMKKVMKKKGKLIIIDGIEDTFNAHARRKGLNVRTAKHRVNDSRWERTEALTTPVLSREEICEKSREARQMNKNRRRLAALGVVF